MDGADSIPSVDILSNNLSLYKSYTLTINYSNRDIDKYTKHNLLVSPLITGGGG